METKMDTNISIRNVSNGFIVSSQGSALDYRIKEAVFTTLPDALAFIEKLFKEAK